MRANLLVLVLAAFLAPALLLADAVASVTVQTNTTSLPGGSSCFLMSSGAQIQCASGNAQMPDLAEAAGSASAAVGSLSVFAGASGDGPGGTLFARAVANASYDFDVLFPAGAPPGMITGEYTIGILAALGGGSLTISQPGATQEFPIDYEEQFIRNPVLLTSAYVAGQPFEISGSASADANGVSEEGASASVQLIGFFDQAGNAIPFTVAPEPEGWPVLGLCLLLVWRRKRIR
ncbi:MAG TPA: hypothetical protein VG345_04640 [Bryobacteraceae bacterium]|jgi:hypothetical protein|nr:hypothetical protein [Bryobacteraceae bacterium]